MGPHAQVEQRRCRPSRCARKRTLQLGRAPGTALKGSATPSAHSQKGAQPGRRDQHQPNDRGTDIGSNERDSHSDEEQRRETARDRHRHRHQESLVRYQRTYSVKSVHTATAVIQADSPA